jgi:N-acetyllactosaminide beta-1,3-N-acetylglucosaminyltransferase
MFFDRNISIKRIIIFLIIIELIIVYLFLKNSKINEFVLKSFDQKSINAKVCGIILKRMVYHSAYGKRNFKHSKQELELTKIVKIDRNCEKSELSILIHSAVNYFDRRQVARETWISEAIKYNISVFFVVGEPKDKETQNKLELESFKYKDLIQFKFKESYYNVTLKHIALLRWAQRKCLNTKYFMKADDDLMVNVRKLIENLNSFKNGINGIVLTQKQPFRVVNSPWFMPECIYPDQYYPDYVFGGAYIMTKDTVNSLVKALEHYSGVVIDIDDAFITGILSDFAGVKRYNTNKIGGTSDCKGRTDFCFMFNSYALMLNNCKANDMVKIWYKWQNTTQEWCKTRWFIFIRDSIILMA